MDNFIALCPPRHLSVIFCGHVDSGKATAASHMIRRMGGYSEAAFAALVQQAEQDGHGSFAYSYYMNTLR